MAGSAACLYDDLARARALVGDAPVIAVNGAARLVKAFALYSKHPDRFLSLGWIRHQKRLFGSDFTVHGSRYREGMPHVDYWWEGARGGGGSAWGARKVASFMGFDLVVLCGCPLDPGPYVGNHSLGGLMENESEVLRMRAEIEAEPEWHEGACSMSGWTCRLLGLPPQPDI